jgi:hypothetical protein
VKRATVRAVRISQPLRIDGVLDETLYRDVRSLSEFIQVSPQQPCVHREGQSTLSSVDRILAWPGPLQRALT